MIDDNNRIETDLPMIDDISVDENDIPPTPEWEKAFSEYAKAQAPDLMPRILAQINLREPEEKKPKGNRVLRFIANNRSRILSLSGIAAAVIIIGVLVTIVISIPKGQDKSEPRGEANHTINETTSTVTDIPKEERRSDSPANPPEDVPNQKLIVAPGIKSIDNEDMISDEPSSSVSDYPVDSKKQFLNIPLTLAPKSSISEDTPPLHLYSHANTYFVLLDITIGDAVSTGQGDAYRVISDRHDTNMLIIWDEDVSGQTFPKLALTYVQRITYEGEEYELFRFDHIVE